MWSFITSLVPWGAIVDTVSQYLSTEAVLYVGAAALFFGSGLWLGHRWGSPSEPTFTRTPPAEPNLPIKYETDETLPPAHIVFEALPRSIYTYGRDTDTTEARLPIPNDLLREAPLSGLEDSGLQLPGASGRFYGYLTSLNPVTVSPRSATLTAYDPRSLRWKRIQYAVPPPNWGYDVGVGLASGLAPLTRSDDRLSSLSLEVTGALRYKAIEVGLTGGIARSRADPYGVVSLTYYPFSR